MLRRDSQYYGCQRLGKVPDGAWGGRCRRPAGRTHSPPPSRPVFLGFQVKVASSHIRKKREKKRRGMMDEVSSLLGRDTFGLLRVRGGLWWWFDGSERKLSYISILVVVVVGRQDELTQTKWWRNKFQSTPSFKVYISIKLCVIHPILRCARQLDMHFYFFYFFSRAIRLLVLVISVSLWGSLIISQRR